jgi:hypothetical protein
MKLNNFFRIGLVFLLMATVALLVSCSSTPSSSDAQQIVQKQIEKFSQGRIKLVSFQKTNGQEGNLMGVKIYNLEYKCEIEFLDNCKWIPPFGTAKLPKSQGFWDKFNDDMLSGMDGRRPMKKGQKADITNQIVFEKTEKGWREVKM